MKFEEIKSDEQRYMVHAYGRFDAALVSGKGAVAKDSEGREYVDFTSGIGVNSLGYCDEGWTKAVSEQAATLQHISNLYYSPLQTDVAKKLCELSGMKKVFLCNSGAEANECAIKIARKYSFDKYGKDAQRWVIITLVNSFHGRTIATLSATGQDVFHNYFFPFVEGFVNGNGETANTAANTAEGFTDTVPGSTAVSGVDDSTKKDSASGASQPVKAEQTKQPEKAAQTAQHSQANSGLTVDEVAKIVVQKVKANPGINEKIRALVIAHGAQRVTELKPENLEAFLTDLSQL